MTLRPQAVADSWRGGTGGVTARGMSSPYEERGHNSLRPYKTRASCRPFRHGPRRDPYRGAIYRARWSKGRATHPRTTRKGSRRDDSADSMDRDQHPSHPRDRYQPLTLTSIGRADVINAALDTIADAPFG